MIVKNWNFKKYYFKYAIIGFIIGLFILVYTFLSYNYHFGELLSNVLIYIPYKIYDVSLYFLNLCPNGLKSGCSWLGLELAVFTSPLYWAVVGFLIGLLAKKSKRKNEENKKVKNQLFES